MILKKEEYLESLKSIIGTRADDAAVKFMEDMTDTYNALEKPLESEDWKKKYEENDNAWRKLYTERFFSSNGGLGPKTEEEEAQEQAENITIDDLFEAKS